MMMMKVAVAAVGSRSVTQTVSQSSPTNFFSYRSRLLLAVFLE